MPSVSRGVSAIREGRAISAARIHYADPIRERLLRFRANVPVVSRLLSRHGDFAASEEGRCLGRSIDLATNGESPLPAEIRDIEGMSGQKYRAFINHLVRLCPNPRYLEIGSWAGSTAASALYGNRASTLCIDNWSQFGGPKRQFFQNMNGVLSDKIQFKFMERDFRSIDYGSIGKFNIYLFDGPHEEADQYDGLIVAQPALTDTFFLIVDDWNWRSVRLGTLRGLMASRCRLECFVEIRTSLDGTHPSVYGKQSDWHNGYFLAVVHRANKASKQLPTCSR